MILPFFTLTLPDDIGIFPSLSVIGTPVIRDDGVQHVAPSRSDQQQLRSVVHFSPR